MSVEFLGASSQSHLSLPVDGECILLPGGAGSALAFWMKADNGGERNYLVGTHVEAPPSWIRMQEGVGITLKTENPSEYTSWNAINNFNGRWIHLIFRFFTSAGPKVNLYIDGVAQVVGAGGDFHVHDFGWGSTNAAESWKGRIAGLAAWKNTSLTDAQIDLLYNRGVINPMAPMAIPGASLFFPLNQNEGETLTGREPNLGSGRDIMYAEWVSSPLGRSDTNMFMEGPMIIQVSSKEGIKRLLRVGRDMKKSLCC